MATDASNDLAALDALDEPGLVDALHQRFEADAICAFRPDSADDHIRAKQAADRSHRSENHRKSRRRSHGICVDHRVDAAHSGDQKR